MTSRLERVEDKLDKLTDICIKTEQHLKDVNGNMLKHQKSIDCHRAKISTLESSMRYYIGVSVGGMAIIGVAFTIINIVC